MRILKGHVRWGQDDRRPSVFLLVDDVPNVGLRYIEHDGVYYAERNGFCSAFRSTPKAFRRVERNGQPNQPYEWIDMADGTQRAVKPTDVELSWLNEHGFGPCIEAYFTPNEEVYAQGFTFHRGVVLASLLREYAAVIDVGTGYAWRPGSRYAAEVAFPQGSCFALACTGTVTDFSRDRGRRDLLWVLPEVLPDGLLVENVRAAIQAAQMANAHDTAHEIASRYLRYLRREPLDTLLALSGYEAAVKMPDGSFWTKPA